MVLRVPWNILDWSMFMTLLYICETFLGLNPGSLNLSLDVQVKTNSTIVYRLLILYVCNLFMCKKARNSYEKQLGTMCLILHLADCHCFRCLEVFGPDHADMDITVCEPPRSLQGNSQCTWCQFVVLVRAGAIGKAVVTLLIKADSLACS